MEQLREQCRFIEMERVSEMSVTDCLITVGDVSYCYDVITDNYSNVDIQCKEEYAEHLEIELRLERC